MSLFWLWTVIIFSLRFCNFLRVEAKINKPCLSFCHRHWPYGLEKELRTFNNYTDSWVRIAWQKMATFLATVAKRCEECVGEKMSSSLSMNLTRNSQYLRAKKEKNLGLLSFYLYKKKSIFLEKCCLHFIYLLCKCIRKQDFYLCSIQCPLMHQEETRPSNLLFLDNFILIMIHDKSIWLQWPKWSGRNPAILYINY